MTYTFTKNSGCSFPFGHGGEAALDRCMAQQGGFEGNGQTLRIVGKLEPYTAEGGMNLTRRTLLGLLKYPILQPNQPRSTSANNGPHKPCKAVYRLDEDLLDWILAPLSASDRQLFQRTEILSQSPFLKSCYKSLDASIMELADDIAYGVHDLEDAIVTGTVTLTQWQQQLAAQRSELNSSAYDFLLQTGSQLFKAEHYLRKEAIGALVNRLITSVQLQLALPDATEPLLRYNACLPQAEQQLLQLLKTFIYQQLILQPELQQLEFRGQHIVTQLFAAFSAEPLRLLPHNTRQRYQVLALEQQGERAVCDYIAGMTDEYAERMYQRLFGRLG